MEAHEALERFDKVHEGSHAPGGLASVAAVVVAVLAAFLAVATFLSNEAVKEVITKETQGADLSAQFETNDIKTIVAESNSTLLRVVAAGNPRADTAVAKAEKLESRIASEFGPADRRLRTQIAAGEVDRARADQRHLLYELSEVGLQVGIVLAGISILARRRWLLGGGGLLGAAGVGLLIAGLVY
jgi:hypothetical protein